MGKPNNLNLVIPVNVVLEIAMVGILSYTCDLSRKNKECNSFTFCPVAVADYVDKIYLGFLVPLLCSSLCWAIYFSRKTVAFRGWRRVVRMAEGAALIVGGLLIIVITLLTDLSWICVFGTKDPICRRNIVLIVAGALMVLNGIFYFIRPCSLVIQPVKVVLAPPPSAVIFQHPSKVEPPPSYFHQPKENKASGLKSVDFEHPPKPSSCN